LRLSWNNYKSDKTSSPKSQDSQDIPF